MRTLKFVLGGFAVWGGLFSSFDCTFTYLRQQEDPWNSISAGFCTGGVLALRAGWRASLKHATIGGVLLAMIEGLGVWLSKSFTPEAGMEEDPSGREIS